MKISSLSEINLFLKKNRKKKIFLLTGVNSFRKSGAFKLFQNKNFDLQIYYKKLFFPEITELKLIAKSLKNFQPEIVLAIGGGSVIDYSKILKVINLNEDISRQVFNNNKFFKSNFELVVIPTTAGSGAEVTANAVIYKKKIKFSVENKLLRPDLFFLVSDFVIKGNRKIKASSGFDAIAQAIESIISIKSNKKSLDFASKSLKISSKNFINFVTKPNLNNVNKMCLAANLSGEAINITKTTAPHALSYPFTAHFGISHGHAVSLTLNDFLKFNFKNYHYSYPEIDLKNRFKIIFDSMNCKNIYELDSFLKLLKKKTFLIDNFESLGISLPRDLGKILKGVNLQRLKNNPIKLKKNDLVSVLKKQY
jgi:alcohol dehydrogenase class IV